MDEPRLNDSTEAVLAEHVIPEPKAIPKKIPALDDVDAQAKAMSGALASAMLTATDTPLTVLQPYVSAMSAQLVAYGWRQTDNIDPDAIYAPAWVVDGVRQESAQVPEQPQHTEADPVVARTDEAPQPPKRIPSHARASRL